MTTVTKGDFEIEEALKRYTELMETHQQMCDAAREDMNELPALHRRIVDMLERQERLADVEVRVYHPHFGEYGNTMTARRLPAPYARFFFHQGAFWQLSSAPALGGEDLLVVEYVAATDRDLISLLCDAELPKYLIFEE